MHRTNSSGIGRLRSKAKIIGTGLGAAAVLTLLVTVRPPDLSEDGARTVVRGWHPHGGPILDTYRQSIKTFERSNPHIACELAYVPNDLSTSQKFFTAVVGDCAPEVIFVDGPQVAEWAERGLLAPLDELLADYLEERGRTLQEFQDEFFAPCWKQCVYRDQTWAITFVVDPNFAFFWNKTAIRQAIEDGDVPAGAIDVDTPPRTIEELDRYNDLLTKRDDRGRLVRVGYVPWGAYGNANSLFTWGWAFGGRFYDDQERRVTANDPRVVAALEWMCSYAAKYDVRRIVALQSSFGTADLDPFILGKQVMSLYHISGVENLDRYAPDLDYGVAPIPSPPDGEPNSSWVGGWTMAIPVTVDPAKRRAALEFILWSCATPEGTSFALRTKQLFPGWKVSPFYEEAVKDRRLHHFVRILRLSKHQRPVMPAQAFYMSELDRASSRAIYGEMEPQKALEEATRRTQVHLDRILARHSGGGGSGGDSGGGP